MGFFSSNATVQSICESISKLASLLVTIFVISGIMNLAEKLGDSAMVEKGKKIYYIIICVNVLALIANIIVSIFGGMTVSMIAAILAIIAAILSIIQYFFYLSYLAKAKKMLGEIQKGWVKRGGRGGGGGRGGRGRYNNSRGRGRGGY